MSYIYYYARAAPHFFFFFEPRPHFRESRLAKKRNQWKEKETKESVTEVCLPDIHTKNRLKNITKSLFHLLAIKKSPTMTTLVIIKAAILDMKDRTGSSLQALNKWIAANEKVRKISSSIPLNLSFSTNWTNLYSDFCCIYCTG